MRGGMIRGKRGLQFIYRRFWHLVQSICVANSILDGPRKIFGRFVNNRWNRVGHFFQSYRSENGRFVDHIKEKIRLLFILCHWKILFGKSSFDLDHFLFCKKANQSLPKAAWDQENCGIWAHLTRCFSVGCSETYCCCWITGATCSSRWTLATLIVLMMNVVRNALIPITFDWNMFDLDCGSVKALSWKPWSLNSMSTR